MTKIKAFLQTLYRKGSFRTYCHLNVFLVITDIKKLRNCKSED